MTKQETNYVPNLQEVAFHEAGHTVTGAMFYPPVEFVSIKKETVNDRAVLGRTIHDLPYPELGDPKDREIFKNYMKVIINALSGKFCQYTVNGVMDEKGAWADYDFLSIYIFDLEHICFMQIWDEITRDFCTNTEFMDMVNIVAKSLLEKEVLTEEEVVELIGEKIFDPEPLLENLVEKYHKRYLGCKKLFI